MLFILFIVTLITDAMATKQNEILEQLPCMSYKY